MTRIVLASASARRKELLEQLIGADFEICISSYAEDTGKGLKPIELVMHHSREKAIDVVKNREEGIIISADMIVVFKGEVLGKPADEGHAKEMLQKISGQKIQVITGLTVMDAGSMKEVTECEITDVLMREMPDKLIDGYVQTGESLGKAGAFGIQGKGAILVERLEGDYFNVVGLPLFRLSKLLEKFNINVLGV
ncbi:Maf family nucleotide pyrophosphatase [Methanolobus mangrovi]|uniref:Nucleoside triphosphate pyrophosphatase n=1 Tax=Methanolobus mangrovi TaxID=3072977 RepID=A0AA51UGU1_9EURY|nr:Maf family nucleotide pyrophosphatase [Methanolobus mangrovi]WMW22905.1 Maf family nucleotide pyrophosphatase [Methanolobus mangrovi]